MNNTELMWYNHYKECNDLDYEQINNFTAEIQADIYKTRILLNIIQNLEEKLNKQSQIIASFESGEMKVGIKHEQISQ